MVFDIKVESFPTHVEEGRATRYNTVFRESLAGIVV